MPYTVKRGDTFNDIAKALGISGADFRAWNPDIANYNAISPGQILNTEAGGTTTETPTDGATPNTNLLGVPGEPEIWKIGDGYSLVYVAPDSDPPVYYSWRIQSAEDLEAILGPDVVVSPSRTIDWAEANRLGLLEFGGSRELANFDADPFATWSQIMETESQSQPWILEPDYTALIIEAMFEGRQLSDAEIQSTNWWRTHSESEREWMKKFHGDPETAQEMLEDNRTRTLESLFNAGVENPSDALVNFMADNVTKGTWTQSYYLNQVSAIADPWSGFTIDSDLLPLIGGAGVTHEGELDIEAQVKTWLGPVHGEWGQNQYEEWAGRIRNDSDVRLELDSYLKGQRLALFPEYENENLTYNDIAAPWKSFVSSIWGQTADETDPMFATLIKNNDSAANAQILRSEGFKKNIGKVVNDAQSELAGSVGGSLRRALR